jgi:hypothetical protein
LNLGVAFPNLSTVANEDEFMRKDSAEAEVFGGVAR